MGPPPNDGCNSLQLQPNIFCSPRSVLGKGKGLIVKPAFNAKDWRTTAQQTKNMASAILGALIERLVDALVQKVAQHSHDLITSKQTWNG
eukprot:Gb_06401 [translate_table: standard]